MKSRNLMAILLIVCMLATVFVACGEKEDGTAVSDDKGTVSASPSTNIVDDDEEPVEIEFWLYDNGNNGSGSKVKDVEAAINEITEGEYGIHVNFKWIATADYGTQLSLAVVNGETVDVALYGPAPSMSWLTMYSNGIMLDMSDLLDEYGQDIKALLGENLLSSTTVNGGVYGMTNYRQLNSNNYIYYRTDILEETGTLDMFKNVTSWSEFEEFLAVLKASDMTTAPIGGTADQPVIQKDMEIFGDAFYTETKTWDPIGDNLYMVWTDQQGNVELSYERESLLNAYKMVADWYAKGYVYSDSAFNTTDIGATLVSLGVMAGAICESEYGVETTKSQQVGYDVTCIAIAEAYVTTTKCTNFGMYITSSSSEPEAAMTFLNAVYTRADIMNLLTWGIEGETYVVNNGVASYPEGKDASTCGYHTDDFRIGNQYLILPWQGQDADFRQKAEESYLAAETSVYLGLAVDTSEFDTLVATLSNIKTEYFAQLVNGMYTESMYNEFIEKIKTAGVDDYIALYQSAVDEFLK